MKKSITLSLILLCLSLLLCACGGSKADNGSDTANPSNTAEAAVQNTSADIDLTKMSSTMIYSKVYDMLDNPEAYIGKTVKMSGAFAVYEGGAGLRDYYFSCVIADATACCQQGMEFRLKDDAVFPDDYPTEGKNITVIGTFNTYMEGEQKYAELKDSTIVT